MHRAKWVVALLVLSLVLALGSLLVACGGSSDGTDTTVGETTTSGTNPPPDKIFNLKFSYHAGPTTSIAKAWLEPWSAAVQEATNGRVQITTYAGESLVKAKDQYDSLVAGLSDVALVEPNQHPGRFPQAEFDSLPFVFGGGDSTVAARVWWDIMEKYSKNTDFKDVVVLGVCFVAPMNYCGNKPVAELADFKDVMIRSDGSVENAAVSALGGTPVEVTTSELFNAAERGMYDGAFLSWSAMKVFKLNEVTKYRTECNLYFRGWPILMNKSAWDSLGPEIQAQIMSVSGKDASAKYCGDNEGLALADKATIVAEDKRVGNPEVTYLTDAEKAAWKTALLPVWQTWVAQVNAAGGKGDEILAEIQELSAQYIAEDAAAGGTATTAGGTPTTAGN